FIFFIAPPTLELFILSLHDALPILCFLDFSNGTTIDDNFETKETSNDDASDKKDEVEQDASESESNTEIITVAQDRLEKNVEETDRKSTRLNSSHVSISYAVFCLKK